MWATSLLTIMLLLSLLSAAPLDIAGGVEDDHDGVHSHDENVTRGGKQFDHNRFDMGDMNISGSVAGDVVSIGHQVKIDVHGHTHDHHHHEDDTVIECKEGLRILFKSIDSNKNGLMDAKELLMVCHQNNIQITESVAVRILTLPDKTVGFNMAKFCELLKNCPSTNSADIIYFLLQQYNEGKAQFPLEECLDMCQSNTCQNDRNVREGCNQMFSCAHGCKLLQLGLERGVCRDLCDRNDQSGCSPNVGGWKFDLCQDCNRGGCTKWPKVEECKLGCNFYNAASCSGTEFDWDCCSSTSPCQENEGDCDTDDDCVGSLVCGKDNCRSINPLAYHLADCCIQPVTIEEQREFSPPRPQPRGMSQEDIFNVRINKIDENVKAVGKLTAALQYIVDGLKALSSARKKRSDDEQSSDETILLELVDRVTNLVEKCGTGDTCESNKIKETTQKITSTFNKMEESGTVSSMFQNSFDQKKEKLFTSISAAEKIQGEEKAKALTALALAMAQGKSNGCYMKGECNNNKQDWSVEKRDTWGCANLNSCTDKDACEGRPKKLFEFCENNEDQPFMSRFIKDGLEITIVYPEVEDCSEDVLLCFCSCPRLNIPVCADGEFYGNLCIYQCAKKKATCEGQLDFPELEECNF